MLDNPSKGGEAIYYTGLTCKSFENLAKEIWCKHRRWAIRCFDKILYCEESWSGTCSCINFNLKKVMEDFLRYGNKYFTQSEGNKFPTGPFFELVLIIIGE